MPDKQDSMARQVKTKPAAAKALPAAARPGRWRRRVWRVVIGVPVAVVLWVAAYAVVNPPVTPYMIGEARILGEIDREWVDADAVSPMLFRAIVAAEDANFCLHWGFDIAAIRAAIDAGGDRGASTITQQVVKNVFLWHGRSWLRKALEGMITPLVELFWSKRRILEVYANIAEFDEGVFGVAAAARHHFNVGPGELTDVQAARLAMVLPAPKLRSASGPNDAQRRRTAQILDGAQTIAADGRDACFAGTAGD